MIDDDYDYCYECRENGDDYSYDEETGKIFCNCPECIFRLNKESEEDGN